MDVKRTLLLVHIHWQHPYPT